MIEEIWKPIPGYEGAYEVSDQGRVKSLERCSPRITPQGTAGLRHVSERFMTGACDDIGRWHVVLRKDRKSHAIRIHRLVLLAFVGPRPDGQIGMHLNGNPGDNRLENLAYGTNSRNQIDVLAHGRRSFTADDIRMMRRKAAVGLVRGDVTRWAKEFGVSVAHVSRVIKGGCYAHVEQDVSDLV